MAITPSARQDGIAPNSYIVLASTCYSEQIALILRSLRRLENYPFSYTPIGKIIKLVDTKAKLFPWTSTADIKKD